MIAVAEALDRIFALVRPLGAECVPLRAALGRVPTEAAAARHAQPPFDASAMDGYAVAAPDPRPGDGFAVIGESAAGHGFGGTLGQGEAVRIFTGAPVPAGAVRVILQENVRHKGGRIVLTEPCGDRSHIRAAGSDFAAGDRFAPSERLRPADIALLAAMGHGAIAVRRRPEVALIATGDELVMPGEPRGPDQIVASNHLGLAAMVEQAGGIARLLPIAGDSTAALGCAFDLAAGADLVVTIGGASVGDHDLVAETAAARGMERSFYTVAMRPGKPLMAGRLAGTPMIGLPGNPVSAMICGIVFMVPALRAMQGLGAAPAPRRTARLAAPLGPNGPREHYMRAQRLPAGPDGPEGIAPFDSQDSARLRLFAGADLLLVRPPGDGARGAGDTVEILDL